MAPILQWWPAWCLLCETAVQSCLGQPRGQSKSQRSTADTDWGQSTPCQGSTTGQSQQLCQSHRVLAGASPSPIPSSV